MTDEQLDQLALANPDAAQYIKILQARNTNLSQEYRIAVNTADQYLIPLTALRKIDRDFRNGELDQIQFNAGIHLFATNS